MCNPALILGAQAVGGGLSAVSAFGAAASQRSGLRYQAEAAELNAVTAERQAAAAMERGQFQVNQVRRAGSQAKGTAVQQYAKDGVDLTAGTPAEVLTSIDILSEQDAQQAEINAIREAWGYRTSAENERSQARSARATASAISPGMAAATSLLGTATSVATSYYGFKQAGAFSGQSKTVGGFGRSSSPGSNLPNSAFKW